MRVTVVDTHEEPRNRGVGLPGDAGAEILQPGKVVGPQIVDRPQRDLPLQLRLARSRAVEDRLAIGMNLIPLAFDGHIIPVQELALVQVLALYQALYGSRVVAVPR